MESKLTRLRNWQSHDFWARVFARPLAILFLYPIADATWITPNLLTHIGNLFFAGGILFIWLDHWVLAAILLQLHLIFDNMDGTLARYRKCGTAFGNYYDKISDYIGISAMFISLGWVAYLSDPDRPHLIVVGCAIAVAEAIGGYSKWVTVAAELKRNAGVPESAAAEAERHKIPDRTALDWVKWFLSSLLRIFLFEEVDYFFWVGLALIIGRLDWMLYLLCATRVGGLLGSLVIRGWKMHKLDRP